MNKLLILISFFFIQFTFSQEHAWVYFADKPDEVSAMANPLSMLSQRALDRRIRQGIALDFHDVPISNTYINQIIAQNGILVKAKSKWLNAVHVYGTASDINALLSLNFVSSIEFADNSLNAKPANYSDINQTNNKFGVLTNYNYGGSLNQSHQIRVDYLHEQNFTGSSMVIAILDAGFPGVDTFSAFQNIRDNNQILGGYNFVERSDNFYQNFRHGTSVLSTIAGYVDGELVGTAPDAKFYLFTTEDVTSETPLEESLWVEAAEKADSLGVDVINTSLGYRNFDETRYNHLYSDMDGNTTFNARGANIAADRGMIVVVSAGNDGNNASYFNISTPADATNVFTIGAVDENNVIGGFSSYGPSYDGRIKPDVCAKGVQTTVINETGNVVTGSGTSYASPVMAGAVACFWEAFPNKTNYEIMQLIRESAHLYNNPTDQEGYGIPNLENAFLLANLTDLSVDDLVIYPNPTQSLVNFKYLKNGSNYRVKIIDYLGKQLMDKTINATDNLDLSSVSNGIYFIKISTDNQSKIIKLIKK